MDRKDLGVHLLSLEPGEEADSGGDGHGVSEVPSYTVDVRTRHILTNKALSVFVCDFKYVGRQGIVEKLKSKITGQFLDYAL